MTHTPAPWTLSDKTWRNEVDPYNLYVTGNEHDDEHGRILCTAVAIVCGNATSGNIATANARLIGAAPDLLAACEAINRLSNQNNRSMDALMDDMERITDLARFAIAKAKGEKP